MKTLSSHLQTFLDETRASLSVEAVLIVPALAWAFVSMFVFFDGFQTRNTNLKAAYAIGDVISREVNPIGPSYIDGLDGLFTYLTHDSDDTWIRVSVIKWVEDDDEYLLLWSKSTQVGPSASELDPETVRSQLPNLSDQENIIVVETSSNYDPIFNVGLGSITFANFIVTSPRFAPTIVWDDDL